MIRRLERFYPIDPLSIVLLAVFISALVAVPWLRVDPLIREPFLRGLAIEVVSVVIVAHVLLLHPELMAAALVPTAMLFCTVLGFMSLVRVEVSDGNWPWVLLVGSVFAWTSILLTCQTLNRFRLQLSSRRRIRMFTLALGVMALMCLLPMTRPRWLVVVFPIALVVGYLPSMNVGFHWMKLLLPRSGKALPWTIVGHERSGNLLRRVRALYSYLRIYDEQYAAWKLRLDPIFSRVYDMVPDSSDVLDAGCGIGLMANGLAMKSPGRKVMGIDLDRTKLRAARCAARTLENARFTKADLMQFAFPPADCVLMIDILHYWTPEKQAKLIAKAAASLRPGGMIVFREGLNSKTLAHRLVHWAERWAVFWKQNPQGDGLCFQDRDFYVRAFEGNGLTVREEVRELGLGSNTVLLIDKPVSVQNG